MKTSVDLKIRSLLRQAKKDLDEVEKNLNETQHLTTWGVEELPQAVEFECRFYAVDSGRIFLDEIKYAGDHSLFLQLKKKHWKVRCEEIK